MKKYFILAAACAMLFTACNKDNKKNNDNNEQTAAIVTTTNTPKSVTIDWKENDVIAVAYLGTFSDFESMTQTVAYQQYCQLYPQLKGITEFAAVTAGDDTYLIITRDAQTDISVNGCDFTDPNNTQILYKNEDGETGNNTTAFLIKGFINGGTPLITLTGVGNGNGLTNYAPQFDDMQQHIKLPKEGGVNDITVYPKVVEHLTKATIHDYEGNEMAVAELSYGRVNVRTDRDLIARMWPDVLWEKGYDINNLNGIAVGVTVANIGNGDNPIIAILMADGTVRTIALVDLITYRNHYANIAHDLDGNPLVDIVDFVDDGSGECINEDGEKFFTYHTIFGVDSKGVRHEIDDSYFCGHYTYTRKGDPNSEGDEGLTVELALMHNYMMMLQVFDMGSLYFKAVFKPTTNHYELPQQFTFEGYNAFETEVSGTQTGKAKGTFTINKDETITLHLGAPYNVDCTLQHSI